MGIQHTYMLCMTGRALESPWIDLLYESLGIMNIEYAENKKESIRRL
jgi:hypothetical protein